MDAPPSSATGVRGLPQLFRDFRGYHEGETILVCGCGASLLEIIAPERLITIGVNDVGRLFDPDYLVVVNSRTQFSNGRFAYVERSRAQAVFTQLDLRLDHPHVVRFRLGTRGGTDFNNPDVLPFTRNSPYPAICLAVHMGARRIGVIGVDFSQHHFFGATGKHVLSAELDRIDQEYKRLEASCRQKGIDIFNLSSISMLGAFRKMSQEEFLAAADTADRHPHRRIFVVNYRFLSCGHVFRDGLAHAASRLALQSKAAAWDLSDLGNEIEAFKPDLLFVVHGRKFSRRFRSAMPRVRSALWLLDEPYEVDDTSRFSKQFDAVFLNDPSTLHRHESAQYLPICYDPAAHSYLAGDERPYTTGFIGGANPVRELALSRLARRDLLSYLVGGPWRDPLLLKLCRSLNIAAEETAQLYRRTRIVLNIFRSVHHYNSSNIAPLSMNPRIYEALQCGALVISEHRPEIESLCPELPTFRSMEEMEYQVERFLEDTNLFASVRKACIRRLAGHTYAQRLRTVLEATQDCRAAGARLSAYITRETAAMQNYEGATSETQTKPIAEDTRADSAQPSPELAADWELSGDVLQVLPDGSIRLSKAADNGPGTESGLIARARHEDIMLEFDMRLEPDTRFIAKIHQEDARDQLSNSYHLMCSGRRAYLARHNHILSTLKLPVGSWISISFLYCDGSVIVRRGGVEVARAVDCALTSGYCFVGVKGGSVDIRNLRLNLPMSSPAWRMDPAYEAFQPRPAGDRPMVSIVTTVYDRVGCLEECLRSVDALEFRDYEHIVVADAPPQPVLEQIKSLVSEQGGTQRTFASLQARANDWGVSPAALGLRMAHGKYVCFLSDDNGYRPTHFNRLVQTLETCPALGFVYSSCQYDGRITLSPAVPRPGRIDLGQPLFRRELFDKYLGGTIPFREHGWDWRMIEHFMRSGVRWQHVNDDTFLFRLAKYPHLMARHA